MAQCFMTRSHRRADPRRVPWAAVAGAAQAARAVCAEAADHRAPARDRRRILSARRGPREGAAAGRRGDRRHPLYPRRGLADARRGNTRTHPPRRRGRSRRRARPLAARLPGRPRRPVEHLVAARHGERHARTGAGDLDARDRADRLPPRRLLGGGGRRARRRRAGTRRDRGQPLPRIGRGLGASRPAGRRPAARAGGDGRPHPDRAGLPARQPRLAGLRRRARAARVAEHVALLCPVQSVDRHRGGRVRSTAAQRPRARAADDHRRVHRRHRTVCGIQRPVLLLASVPAGQRHEPVRFRRASGRHEVEL